MRIKHSAVLSRTAASSSPGSKHASVPLDTEEDGASVADANDGGVESRAAVALTSIGGKRQCDFEPDDAEGGGEDGADEDGAGEDGADEDGAGEDGEDGAEANTAVGSQPGDVGDVVEDDADDDSAAGDEPTSGHYGGKRPLRLGVAQKGQGQRRPTRPVKPAKRLAPGVRAIRDIRKQQASTELCLRKAPVYRVIRDVNEAVCSAMGLTYTMRWQSSALQAMHEAAEDALINHIFGMGNGNTIHAGRVTLMEKDIQKAVKDQKLCDRLWFVPRGN